MVSMNAQQYGEIEQLIYDLMRADETERASRMMSLALAYKFARDVEPALPENVVPLHTSGHSLRV